MNQIYLIHIYNLIYGRWNFAIFQYSLNSLFYIPSFSAICEKCRKEHYKLRGVEGSDRASGIQKVVYVKLL